jgi:hypothetical protein
MHTHRGAVDAGNITPERLSGAVLVLVGLLNADVTNLEPGYAINVGGGVVLATGCQGHDIVHFRSAAWCARHLLQGSAELGVNRHGY